MISRDVFTRWVDNSANEKYWRGKDNALAKAGAEQAEFSMLKTKSAKIILNDAWQMSGKYWEVYPDLNISRLKIELDARIQDELDKAVRVSFDDIFSWLLERGFMLLNIYAFLTGFLLKEYASDPYRFSADLDGNLGGAMNISKLAEYIGDSIKQAQTPVKNYRPKSFHDLKIFLTAQRVREIFTDFLKTFEGGIIFDLARRIGIENPVEECRRRIAAGDGIWLNDKATATDDLTKLVVDYNIVVESQKFGIYGKSFNACVQGWQEYCRFNLKIPADTIGEYYPTLKNFFALLKELTEHGELPQGKRENFLRQLVDDTEAVREALSEPVKVLRVKYSYQLDGLTDDEIKNLYTLFPNSSFTDSQGRYHKMVVDFAKKTKSNQLVALWREVVGNKLPREWSKEHRTPILAMVPQAEQDSARKVFNALMTISPDEGDVKFAIDYLEKRPSYLNALNDERRIEEVFRREIIGDESSALLQDNDEVRNVLELKISADAYQLYSNSRVNAVIKELTKDKYYTGEAHDKVTERVMRMSDEDAKRLLIELLDKNYEVGLKLLRES